MILEDDLANGKTYTAKFIHELMLVEKIYNIKKK